MYKAIGCGIAQLVPNDVAQISGFIALCVEKNRILSLKLFLSIYGVGYLKGQVFVDTRPGRSKIVSVKSSNSGYYSRWIYFYEPDLEFVRPYRSISKATIDCLNNLEKYDRAHLDSFQGSRPVYDHLQLKSVTFLTEHCRKRVSFYYFVTIFCFKLVFFFRSCLLYLVIHAGNYLLVAFSL